jgi:cellulose synthase/poly-beta-1,6-N-acetylglucosamine synthase-like glycosyltransferase/peptidoglycan/xylan/chitin deacetylase (PgdA/CDA1 family)
LSRQHRASRRPPTHWLVFGLVLFSLIVALLTQGYTAHRVGKSTTAGREVGPLAELASSGPVLDLSGARLQSARPGLRTVALTFDDGPDPRWTPAILDVLHRHHVPATFFVVGSRVVAHPSLVRRELAEGHEIGSHTFVHSDVAAIPRWQANLELSLTQTALAGATGRHTGLFRPPYSSNPGAIDARHFTAYRDVGRQGYLVVLADRDGEDWQRPGVTRILAGAEPSSDDGAVVLLHDGGGDRHQTVLALDRLIGDLQARHFRFTTVSGALGLAPQGADVRVRTVARLQGVLFLRAQQAGRLVTGILFALLVPIGALTLLRALVLVVLARGHVRRSNRGTGTGQGDIGRVTVVVPAYNEEVGIAAAVRSLAASTYPGVEVVVVDDGSTDATAEIVRGLDLPNVHLVQQRNAGKATALNTGIAASSGDLVVTVDGDTVFEPDTIGHLVGPFVDPTVGAVSGNTKVGNRRRILGRWQHIEYVMGFNLDRRMYEVLDCMPTVPGAIGAFRRTALAQVGGVSDDTLAEDTDLTMALNRAGWRVVYEPHAIAWTEAPATLGSLWRQRYRWSYGTMQSMWKHRGAVREPEHHHLGRRALPYLFVFQVMLPVLAPAIDLFALYGVLFLDPVPVLLYWLGFNAVQLALGIYAFRLDGERLGPLWLLPLQQFVYRQLMYLVVIQSVATALVGTRLRWHKLPRTGDVGAAGGTVA